MNTGNKREESKPDSFFRRIHNQAPQSISAHTNTGYLIPAFLTLEKGVLVKVSDTVINQIINHKEQ